MANAVSRFVLGQLHSLNSQKDVNQAWKIMDTPTTQLKADNVRKWEQNNPLPCFAAIPATSITHNCYFAYSTTSPLLYDTVEKSKSRIAGVWANTNLGWYLATRTFGGKSGHLYLAISNFLENWKLNHTNINHSMGKKGWCSWTEGAHMWPCINFIWLILYSHRFTWVYMLMCS